MKKKKWKRSWRRFRTVEICRLISKNESQGPSTVDRFCRVTADLMARALRCSRMVSRPMKGGSRTASATAMVELSRARETFTRATSLKTPCMEKASSIGPMAEFTKESGNQIKRMDKESTSGPTARCMRESLGTTTAQASEFFIILTARNLRASGKMERSTELATTSIRTGPSSRRCIGMALRWRAASS